MNTREKLIDLITGFYGVDPMYYGVETQPLADHLIANGVTIPVRCNDCKYFDVYRLECHNGRLNGIAWMDGFCSNGERRVNEHKNKSTVYCKVCKRSSSRKRQL